MQRPTMRMPIHAVVPDPSHHGITRFGGWSIPGPAGPQPLVLATDPGGSWIEASLDGQIMLTVPRPTASEPSVSSAPSTIGSHALLIYAETWDRGRTVRCDVFVDGYSLATGEPVAVIGQRGAAAWDWAMRTGRSGLLGKLRAGDLLIAAVFTLSEMAVVGREARSFIGLVMAAALVVTLSLALVRPWRFACGRLYRSGWQQPWVGLAACGLALGFGITAVPVTIVALALARLGG